MKFSSIEVEWSPKTFIFYLSIIIGCYIITWAFRKKNIKWGPNKKNKYPLGLCIVALILLYVKCFNTTGRDLRGGYVLNFESATSMAAYRDQTVEPGFRLLMVIIKNVSNSYPVFLFVTGLITLIPIFYFLKKYKDRIDIPASILLFLCLYYINGFSAYRQYMAASLSLFVFDAIIEKKTNKALLWIAISSTFHITCLALVVPYILCFARLFSKKMITISAIVFFAIVLIGRNSIGSYLAGSERYYVYMVSQEVSIGLEQIVYYLPLFYLIHRCRKIRPDKTMARTTYIYLITGFVFGLLSYVVPIFGRMSAIFLPIIIVVPYYIRVFKAHNGQKRRIALNLITIFYCLARFVIWITQYYGLEDLMPYTNVFGRVI